MLDLSLNIGFGLIGVFGVILAIIQWRQSEKVTDLFERTLEAIAQNAEDLSHSTTSPDARQFSRQVQRQCYALIRQRSQMGRYWVLHYPAESTSRLQTNIGVRTSQQVQRRGQVFDQLILEARTVEDANNRLIYGPHERLPIIGTYRVNFRSLKLTPPDGAGPDDLIATLDVYGTDRVLAEKHIYVKNLAENGHPRESDLNNSKQFDVTFRYRDVTEQIEYRINIPIKDVYCSIYDLSVERIGR